MLIDETMDKSGNARRVLEKKKRLHFAVKFLNQFSGSVVFTDDDGQFPLVANFMSFGFSLQFITTS